MFNKDHICMLLKRQKKWSHNATTHVIPCDSFGLENHASMIFWCQNCSPRVVLQLVLNLLNFLASVSHTSLCITNQLFLITRFEGLPVSSFNTLLFVRDSLVFQNLTLMTLAFQIFTKVNPLFLFLFLFFSLFFLFFFFAFFLSHFLFFFFIFPFIHHFLEKTPFRIFTKWKNLVNDLYQLRNVFKERMASARQPFPCKNGEGVLTSFAIWLSDFY